MTSVSAITPAREAQLVPATPAERIEVCLQIMRAGMWVRGETNKQLAEQWDVTVRTVEMAACAASAAIRRDMPDGELRDEVVARLDNLAHMAADGGDVLPAVAALKAMLEARGLLKQKHEVSFAQKPTAELYADAWADAGFREWVLEQLRADGWRGPETIEAEGSEVL